MKGYSDIREECCGATKSLPTSGLVNPTSGNVSVCHRRVGVLTIKASGVNCSVLTPHDAVIVDLEGKVVEGTLNSSSDTPVRRRLFLAFSDIRSVVHIHSRKTVAFAQAVIEISLLGTTFTKFCPQAENFRGA